MSRWRRLLAAAAYHDPGKLFAVLGGLVAPTSMVVAFALPVPDGLDRAAAGLFAAVSSAGAALALRRVAFTPATRDRDVFRAARAGERAGRLQGPLGVAVPDGVLGGYVSGAERPPEGAARPGGAAVIRSDSQQDGR